MAPIRWIHYLHETISKAFNVTLTDSFKIEKQTNGIHWYPYMLHKLTDHFLSSFIKFS